mgnify:CR=1 FL=1
MSERQALEDERGVDVAQIRVQLALSVPERVRTMVDAANRLIELQAVATPRGGATD